MPIDYGRLAKQGLISPAAAERYGLTGDPEAEQAGQQFGQAIAPATQRAAQGGLAGLMGMPSWAEQAQQFAGRDPRELLKDPAFTQFVMGITGPASTAEYRAYQDFASRMANARQNAFAARQKRGGGGGARVISAAKLPKLEGWDRSQAEAKSAWDSARGGAIENYRNVAFPERYESEEHPLLNIIRDRGQQ